MTGLRNHIWLCYTNNPDAYRAFLEIVLGLVQCVITLHSNVGLRSHGCLFALFAYVDT